MTILTTVAQQIDIQDLTNNNGYIPIKTEEIKVIDHYSKILHIINITAYEDTVTLILHNIQGLAANRIESKHLLDTVNKNFLLLEKKIENLNPHFRHKRGLINVLGKGLKVVAGTMDSDDETKIKNSLEYLSNNGKILTDRIHNLTFVNNLLSSQIQNITNHINNKQIVISDYLNKFKNFIQNKIMTIEDEIEFMQQIYQVNNDISLLRDHIDDIGQIIFSSKLGIIPTDILTETELNLINDFDSYSNIKVSVAVQEQNIIIILKIPNYSRDILSKILFEPIPNAKNKTIILKNYEILVDNMNNIFNVNVKENLKQNLKKIVDDCLKNILNFEEAYCDMQIFEETVVNEILPGILIFKNFYSEIVHNCNKTKIKIKGNFLINFENCEIKVMNKTFSNVKMKAFDQFILPNMITKIKYENTSFPNLKLKSLYLKQLNQDDHIKLLVNENYKTHIISLSTDVALVFIIVLVVFILVFIIKHKHKLYVSPVSQGKTEDVSNLKNGPFLQVAIS